MNIKKDYIAISAISDEVLNSIRLLKNKATINLKPTGDEFTYYNNLKTLFAYLKSNKKTYNIRIYIKNRELFRKLRIIANVPNNINLIIFSNDYEYSQQEYLAEEEKLEKLAKPIRDSSLSPLEKYIAAYDIVKKFRPYKDNKQDSEKSRTLKYILEEDNEYIVCVGYASLLHELLNRIGIPNKYLHTNVDDSYNDGFTQEEKTINLLGHARNLVKLDDDKYQIHGYFLADTTWDNHPKYDLYLNCLLTFDRKKEAKRLESLEEEDLLLDFHNVDEFIAKIKYYIKRKIGNSHADNNIEEKMRTRSYKELYLKINSILSETDKQKQAELFDKYNTLLNIDIDSTNSSNLEPIMIEFLTDYAKYIIPLSNNEVNLETILRAAIEVKSKLYKKPTSEIKNWLMQTIKDNEKAANIAFPYIYDPNNPREAYVETRSNKR